jgi:hypothetical protein
MKTVTTASDCLDKPHFAVLQFDSITIPGDERSRTNPGHGYPESTEHIVRYTRFDDEADMKKWVEKEEKNRRTYGGYRNIYKVIWVNPLTVSTEVKISVGPVAPAHGYAGKPEQLR